jgi:hypothetical protein
MNRLDKLDALWYAAFGIYQRAEAGSKREALALAVFAKIDGAIGAAGGDSWGDLYFDELRLMHRHGDLLQSA